MSECENYHLHILARTAEHFHGSKSAVYLCKVVLTEFNGWVFSRSTAQGLVHKM